LRTTTLAHDPELENVTMETLVCIANAIERESVRRYERLEEIMRRRGETETAEAFRLMAEEERGHVDAVAEWAAGLDVTIPEAHLCSRALPDELATSWEEIEGSSLLTPYRAFALAVENEQRAFSFYTYLASRASDPRVAREAEHLAADELRHAAHLRRWRRKAYHRERGERQAETAIGVPEEAMASADALLAFLRQRLAVIAAGERRIADRLHEAGDTESAEVLEALIDRCGSDGMPAGPAEAGAGEIPTPDGSGEMNPVHLLISAQKPLEALIESLETVLAATEGEVFAVAERAIADAVGWLARLSARIEKHSVASAG